MGIRADAPNQLWHIDVTIIKLLDGTKAYFGNGDAVVIDLAAVRVRARQVRMKVNRMAACGVCAGGPHFGALQLQRPECEMS